MAQENWNCDTADGQGCQQRQQEGPVLCSNNCGLLGSATTMNLCSKCFREQGGVVIHAAEEAAIVVEKPAFSEKPMTFVEKSLVSSKEHAEKAAENESMVSLVRSAADGVAIAVMDRRPSCSSALGAVKPSDLAALLSPSPSPSPSPLRQNTHRCLACRKRTGLLGFKCRCGNVFCATHRYSDKHSCPFDYKAAARAAIAKANPVVKAPKVEKI